MKKIGIIMTSIMSILLLAACGSTSKTYQLLELDQLQSEDLNAKTLIGITYKGDDVLTYKLEEVK